MKVTTIATATVGRGNGLHRAILADNGHLTGVACGAGLGRRGNNSAYYRQADVNSIDAITCGRCRKA